MRVMCIDESPSRRDGKSYGLKFGENYTVVNESVCPRGFLHYELEEMGENEYFGAFRFVRVSEIDEMELVKERELQEA